VTTAQTVQLAIEYDPRPPLKAGSPKTAPANVIEPSLGPIGMEETRLPEDITLHHSGRKPTPRLRPPEVDELHIA
jgi:hypothetical protein